MIVAGLLYLGMFALAAGMSRHADPLLGAYGRISAPRRASVLGWTLVALSLLIAILTRDGGQALVLWFGLVPLVSAILLLALTYRPLLARIGALGSAILILAGLFG